LARREKRFFDLVSQLYSFTHNMRVRLKILFAPMSCPPL